MITTGHSAVGRPGSITDTRNRHGLSADQNCFTGCRTDLVVILWVLPGLVSADPAPPTRSDLRHNPFFALQRLNTVEVRVVCNTVEISQSAVHLGPDWMLPLGQQSCVYRLHSPGFARVVIR